MKLVQLAKDSGHASQRTEQATKIREVSTKEKAKLHKQFKAQTLRKGDKHRKQQLRATRRIPISRHVE